MTQDNLFSGDDTNNTPQIDPSKNYYEELVGDGKKFKDSEALAKGKYTSDLYIKNLEDRLDEMRQDYLKLLDEHKTRASLEELADQLKQRQGNPAPDNVPPDNSVKPIDPKDIESLVSSKIQEHEMTKKQTENFQMVETKLKEVYGDSYKQVLRQNMDRLGLTEDFVNDLARKHPQVLFKTFGVDEQPRGDSFQAPPRSSVRNDTFAPKGNNRTWSYYQKLKQSNPRQYFDPRTQVQMHKDAVELGNAFQDGDWSQLNSL